MPLKCPKCSRVNADNAEICIYCKTSLENAEYYEPPEDVSRLAQHYLSKGGKQPQQPQKPPSETAPPASKKPEEKQPGHQGRPALKVIPGGKAHQPVKAGIAAAKRAERFWVILAPVKSVAPALNEALAEKLKMDPYFVRQRFATGNPWLIRKFDNPEQARDLNKELLKLGLDVYSVSDSEIGEVPEFMPALKVSIEEGGLLFERAKEQVRLRWDDALLIVKGEIKLELTEDSLGKRKKKQVKQPGLRPMASDHWHYEIYDIYPRSGRGVRLSERDTNFTGLGKYRSPSSLRNLRWIVSGLETYSSITINDGYRRTLKEFKPVAPRSDYVHRRLGRMQEQQMDMRYTDNTEHFDEFSILAYLHFRKLEG